MTAAVLPSPVGYDLHWWHRTFAVNAGTDYAVNKPMLIEFTPRRGRGRLLGSLSVAWAAGYSCAYGVGFALDGPDPNSWRWMLLTAAVPCLLVLPLRHGRIR
jgi:putative MFS transporter